MQLAEHLGHEKPLGIQRLLSRASWDGDGLRDELIRYGAEHLGSDDSVLIVDETGFLKKGIKSVDCNAATFGVLTEKGQQHWLLIRRHIETKELAFHLCRASSEATANDLARAAGRRWAIEVCLEMAKQQTGLDEYEVRSWDGWHRHMTLSMLAAAFLTAVRVEATRAKSHRSKSRKN